MTIKSSSNQGEDFIIVIDSIVQYTVGMLRLVIIQFLLFENDFAV